MSKVNNIITYDFEVKSIEKLAIHKLSSNWPVVYMIHNKDKMYIGETTSFERRFSQHIADKSKSYLKKIVAIYDSELNKSSALDIEQNLIRLFSSDGKFKILNGNSGQSSNHNYYQREMYFKKMPVIWSELLKRDLAENSYLNLLSSELYSYSPYITLTDEQLKISYLVLNEIMDALNNDVSQTSIINGGAGTGKTILAINLIFNLISTTLKNIDFSDLPDDEYTFEEKVMRKIIKYNKEHGEIKLAFVVPMTSLRKTLNKVFKHHKHILGKVKVIGTSEITKEKFDLLIVDETHRLWKYKAIAGMEAFKKTATTLGFDHTKCNQLDWIVKQSKTRILFYDENQTIKPADITPNEMKVSLEKTKLTNYYLKSQMRSKGGESFDKYVKDILHNKSPDVQQEFIDFDIYIIDKIKEMENIIIQKNSEVELSRMVSGFAWKWISKGYKKKEEIKKLGLEDIEIEGYKYIWNMSNIEFTLKPDSVVEIGCIHTTQGYDLNYVGVIFGREIDYDFNKNSITINKQLFFDTNVKKTATDEEIKKYIINAYHTMMLRGIKGCYVYAYNKNMKEYLSKYFKTYKKNND